MSLIVEAAVISVEVLTHPAPAMGVRPLLPIPTEQTILGKIQLVLPGKKVHPTGCCSCLKEVVFCPSWEKYSRYSEMHFNDLHIMWNKSFYSPNFLLSQFSTFLTCSLKLLLSLFGIVLLVYFIFFHLLNCSFLNPQALPFFDLPPNPDGARPYCTLLNWN